MKAKTKLILWSPIILWYNFRAKRLSRKMESDLEGTRYPVQWRNDLVIKRSIRLLKLANIKLEVKGFENIPKQTAVIAPNHCSAFDPIILMAALKNPGESLEDINHKILFIAKEELKKHKRLSGYANLINTFYIDRKKPRQALKVLEDAVEEAKKSKRHLGIFPEGTRSNDGTIHDFKAGAFRIAKRAFIPIVPVTINNSYSSTDISRTNYINVEIIFHKPLKPLSFMDSDTKGIAMRVQKIVEKKWVKPEVTSKKYEKKAAK